jgi:hypothetical protein
MVTANAFVVKAVWTERKNTLVKFDGLLLVPCRRVVHENRAVSTPV